MEDCLADRLRLGCLHFLLLEVLGSFVLALFMMPEDVEWESSEEELKSTGTEFSKATPSNWAGSPKLDFSDPLLLRLSEDER